MTKRTTAERVTAGELANYVRLRVIVTNPHS